MNLHHFQVETIPLNLAVEVLPVCMFRLVESILSNLNRVSLARIILLAMDQVWRPGREGIRDRINHCSDVSSLGPELLNPLGVPPPSGSLPSCGGLAQN